VRALYIGTLMDGGERSASQLAALARATSQSASAHLSSLVAGGLLTVRPQGRHRFYRLRNEQVAAAIEVLSLRAAETAPQPRLIRKEIGRMPEPSPGNYPNRLCCPQRYERSG
jgi:DNA-binding transcriptional ArsR family regulator